MAIFRARTPRVCPLAGTWMDRASVCVKEVRGKEVGGMKAVRGEGSRGKEVGGVKEVEVRGEGRRGGREGGVVG